MTLGSLLLTLLAAYLAVIAYGVVGARRKLSGAALRIVQACLILTLPAALVGALIVTGDGEVVRKWGRLFAAMPLLGLVTLIMADRIAAKADA